MKWFGKVAKITLFAVYAVCALALLTFMIPATGLQAKSVVTGSMRPAIATGSLIILQRTHVRDLAVGDIVTYSQSPGSDTTITHRIIKEERQKGIPYFVTKGDSNIASDHPIAGGQVIGKVIYSVPGLGFINTWLRSPLALLFIVIIPGIFVIVGEWLHVRKVLRDNPKPAKNQAPADRPPPPPAPPTARVAAMQRQPDKRRPMDGMGRRMALLVGGLALLAAVPPTWALQSNVVALTGISLSVSQSTVPTDKEQCKNDGWKQFKNPDGSQRFRNQGQCIAFVVSNSHSNHNNVDITNSNNQTATSGNVSVSGNTSTGNASSGNTGNSNNTSTNVTITSSPSPTPTITPSPVASPTPSPSPTP